MNIIETEPLQRLIEVDRKKVLPKRKYLERGKRRDSGGKLEKFTVELQWSFTQRTIGYNCSLVAIQVGKGNIEYLKKYIKNNMESSSNSHILNDQDILKHFTAVLLFSQTP
ncbi:uncharacterized protein ZBAI_08638 [Zygosaccharomyces bailii ISA1307]|nr:uncharacterized protein ZBAI_08638 [Zygosaccharomyces bailii ISA1307]